MRHDPSPFSETFEFKVIPAPRKGERVPGLTTDDSRMAYTMTKLFNRMGAEGWDYVRADTLPSEARADVTGIGSREHNMLVFRRLRARPSPVAAAPLLLTEPSFDAAGHDPA